MPAGGGDFDGLAGVFGGAFVGDVVAVGSVDARRQDDNRRGLTAFERVAFDIGLHREAGAVGGRDREGDLVAVDAKRAGDDLHLDRPDHEQSPRGDQRIAEAGIDHVDQDIADDLDGIAFLHRVGVFAASDENACGRADGRIDVDVEAERDGGARGEEARAARAGDHFRVTVAGVERLNKAIANDVGVIALRGGVVVFAAVDSDLDHDAAAHAVVVRRW